MASYPNKPQRVTINRSCSIWIALLPAIIAALVIGCGGGGVGDPTTSTGQTVTGTGSGSGSGTGTGSSTTGTGSGTTGTTASTSTSSTTSGTTTSGTTTSGTTTSGTTTSGTTTSGTTTSGTTGFTSTNGSTTGSTTGSTSSTTGSTTSSTTGSTTGTTGGSTGSTDYVAFLSYRNGSDGDVFRMSFTGTDVTRLTTNTGIEGPPAVSHDGTKIAFFRDGGGTSGIFTMDADGTDSVRIRSMVSAGSITFSPDGARIAFINLDSSLGATNEIFLMNVNGSNLVQFTSGAFANGRGLSWSPDGTRLAFVSNTPAPNVYYVALAGGPRQQIVIGEEPSFSPNGNLLLFKRNVSGNVAYYVSNIDGSGVQQVLNTPGVDRAVFHPNGTSLFFDRNTLQPQIFRIDSNGVTTNISNNAFTDRFPAVRGSP